MIYKIGIFGSNIKDEFLNDEILKKTNVLADTLSKKNAVLITGACSGLPYKVAYQAAKKGIKIIGYSPELNLEGQKKFAPKDDLSIYKKIIYIPDNFIFKNDPLVCKKYRNVISTANCDAGIIISGRWGTMNEFTNLYDMGKVIGVLTKTGGIADMIQSLNKKIIKKSKAKIFFSDSPKKLVKMILDELRLRTYNRPL